MGMRRFPSVRHSGGQVSLPLLGAGICLLALAPLLLADTTTLLRRTPTAGCYCPCTESKLAGGCVKICESKKYASRWWGKELREAAHEHAEARLARRTAIPTSQAVGARPTLEQRSRLSAWA